MMRFLVRSWIVGLVMGLVPLVSAQDAPPAGRDAATWTLQRLDPPVAAAAPTNRARLQLVLDDGSREVDIGFNASTAFQFLWFNQFAPPAPDQAFVLEQIQVLFPPGPEVVPGSAIQLVVLSDTDGDPSNGATLQAIYDEVIQVADGSSFSVYPLATRLTLSGTDDLLVGVINRFVSSGISPPSRPAALDTSSVSGRSWVALWSGDPPDPPSLPSDDTMMLIDRIEPGSWMIRAQGRTVAQSLVPTQSPLGLLMLIVVLALAGVALLRH